jgi:hypothetical protein
MSEFYDVMAYGFLSWSERSWGLSALIYGVQRAKFANRERFGIRLVAAAYYSRIGRRRQEQGIEKHQRLRPLCTPFGRRTSAYAEAPARLVQLSQARRTEHGGRTQVRGHPPTLKLRRDFGTAKLFTNCFARKPKRISQNCRGSKHRRFMNAPNAPSKSWLTITLSFPLLIGWNG